MREKTRSRGHRGADGWRKGLLPIQKYADEVVLVDEEEITKSILFLLERDKFLAEVAGAAGVAALLHGKIVTARRTVAALVSGGNIDVTLVARMIEPRPSQGWQAGAGFLRGARGQPRGAAAV